MLPIHKREKVILPTATSPSTHTKTIAVFFGNAAKRMKDVGSEADAQDWLEHEHPHDVAGKHIDVAFAGLRHKPQDVRKTIHSNKRRTLTLYASFWVERDQVETFRHHLSEMLELQRAILDAPLPRIYIHTGSSWQIIEPTRLNL